MTTATLTRIKHTRDNNGRPWTYSVEIDGKNLDRLESGHIINLLDAAIRFAKRNGATKIVKQF